MTAIFKVILAMIFFITIPAAAQASPAEYQIYTAGGQKIISEDLGRIIDKYDVIIFGEYHDHALLHRLEAGLLHSAYARQNKLAVSLEMFERDVQSQLNGYLAGELTETEFLDRSRPWKNYRDAYRPLVEFAKTHSLPVIAANIPRTMAAHYARTGSLKGIEPEMAVYLPQLHSAPEGEYRRNFMAYMSSGQMPVTKDKLEDYYKAQCLKDDTMAESIAGFIRHNPGYKVIHYQGDFHSRQRLGVAEKLQLLQPELKVAVITPVYAGDLSDLPDLLRQHRQAGDVIIFLKQAV